MKMMKLETEFTLTLRAKVRLCNDGNSVTIDGIDIIEITTDADLPIGNKTRTNPAAQPR